MYTIQASARTLSRIVRTKVLLIVAHPVVGPGLETILRLEGCEVRRVSRLADAGSLAAWRPDVALVDGVLLKDTRVSLGLPSLVLAGGASEGEPLRARLDDARGWLRKDATARQLRAAIARVVRGDGPQAWVTRRTLIAVVAATAAGALFLAVGMLVVRAAG
jgi:DNA-binding NarL/FixJ family response regulator